MQTVYLLNIQIFLNCIGNYWVIREHIIYYCIVINTFIEKNNLANFKITQNEDCLYPAFIKVNCKTSMHPFYVIGPYLMFGFSSSDTWFCLITCLHEWLCQAAQQEASSGAGRQLNGCSSMSPSNWVPLGQAQRLSNKPSPSCYGLLPCPGTVHVHTSSMTGAQTNLTCKWVCKYMPCQSDTSKVQSWSYV